MNNNESFLFVLRDSQGTNWGVWVYHEGNVKQLYTREVDIEGIQTATIKTFDGMYKIKVGTNGQLITYPLDDLG